jgi:hypothetical protein
VARREEGVLTLVLERIAARFGPERVLQPYLVDAPQCGLGHALVDRQVATNSTAA